MSYQHMDHAEWVHSNNAAGRRISKPKKDKDYRTVGYHGAPERLTDFQARVMDIAGMVFRGIYNAPIHWESVDWNYGRGISFRLEESNRLATFDYDGLTKLVFLCHEARIRCQIDPSMRSLRLSFWPRVSEGDMMSRHPNLDEAVAAFREYLPSDHRIIYRAAEPSTEADAA